MPYYPPPVTGFVPLNGSLPMTGTLTTPAVIASSNGTAAAPAFAVNTNYGIYFDTTNTALGVTAAGTEIGWFGATGTTFSKVGAGYSLTVQSEGNNVINSSRFTSDNTSPAFQFNKARGTMAAPTVPTTNDGIGTQFSAMWSGATFSNAARLRTVCIETSTVDPTHLGAGFQFDMCAIGGSAFTEVMRLEVGTGLSMYGANQIIDANRTVILNTSTTAGLPASVTGGLRYVSDLEGGSGIAFGGIGNVYRNVENGQVVTATVTGMGVLSEFTGFCNYPYRVIVQNTYQMLINAGLFTKLPCFLMFAVPTNQNDALINWATPGTRNATITGTPVFTPNQGFTGDSATALITAGGNIANFGGSQNNLTVGAYVLVANTAGAAERAVIGQNVPGQGRRTYLTSFTSGTLHSEISTQTAGGDAWTPPRYTGLFVMSRNLSTGYNDSVDDVAATAITSTSTTFGSTVCWLGTNDTSGTSFSNAQVACGFIGVGLTTTDVANLRTIIRDYYLTQIGAISANYTVALLPLVTSVPAGTRYNVTDATLTTFASTVIGGGTNFVPVINNGTNWIIGVMLYQISVEGSDGAFVPWEIIDLPNSAAAYERCQSLSALHEGKTFSAGPVPPPAMMVPLVEVKGWLRRSPVTVAAICGAVGSGPIWWLIFHYL